MPHRHEIGAGGLTHGGPLLRLRRGGANRPMIVRKEAMGHPDYIKLLKLDKIALKSRTRVEYITAAGQRIQYARNLGVESSFVFFVERAWADFGDGE